MVVSLLTTSLDTTKKQDRMPPNFHAHPNFDEHNIQQTIPGCLIIAVYPIDTSVYHEAGVDRVIE